VLGDMAGMSMFPLTQWLQKMHPTSISMLLTSPDKLKKHLVQQHGDVDDGSPVSTC
jgi:hypothetical protein